MLNELDEFRAYTEQPIYTSSGKRDTSYLGRFTFDMLLDFEGLARVLTIVARGYMWQTDKPDVDRARRALYAWCSVPNSKKASPHEDWQYRTDFRDLQDEFPELVDGNGCGWFYRHIHGICDFFKANPTITSKTAQDNCAKLKGFDTVWRNKVKQLQMPIFLQRQRAHGCRVLTIFSLTHWSLAHYRTTRFPSLLKYRNRSLTLPLTEYRRKCFRRL